MTAVTDLAPSDWAPDVPIGSRRDLWQQWLAMAAADAKGQATPEQSALLRQPGNLLRWLRTLSALESDVNARMGESRLRVDALRPPLGEPPSREYVVEKRAHEARHGTRVRFRNSVTQRQVECKFLLHEQGIDERVTLETVLLTMSRAMDRLEQDDPDAARGMLAGALRDAEAHLR